MGMVFIPILMAAFMAESSVEDTHTSALVMTCATTFHTNAIVRIEHSCDTQPAVQSFDGGVAISLRDQKIIVQSLPETSEDEDMIMASWR